MALTKQWIRPSDWLEGDYPRTDAHPWIKKYVLRIHDYYSAADDLDGYRFLDISGLKGADGKVAVRTVITKVEWQIFGINMRLFWDRPASSSANPFANIGATAVESHGVLHGPMIDPGRGDGSDGTGDFLINTVDSASKDSYDVRIHFNVKTAVRHVDLDM